MKAKIYGSDGKLGKEITLPSCFSEKLRLDLISKVLRSKITKQPYSNSPVAGKQASASGILIHRRHVWKSQYGKGMSRVPRKIMMTRGSQFRWEGATSPNTRGGRRAHPPKVVAAINTSSINKKEMKIALRSALSATLMSEIIVSRYKNLEGKKLNNLPMIVDGEVLNKKVKDLTNTIKNILGEAYEVVEKKKTIRAGKGKLRGRKYKSNAGLLIVKGKDEKIKTKSFEIKTAENLSVKDLAKGGPGRLVVYTERAINEIGEKLK